MKGYDKFFQHHVFDGSVAQGIEFSEDMHYAVINFQGWMYCPIPLRTAMEFITQFGSHIVQHNDRTLVVFRRWEALHDQASISPPAGTPSEGTDTEVVRGHLEIREIHQSFYVPYDQQRFDLNGFPDYRPSPSRAEINNSPNKAQHSAGRPPRNWVEAIAHSASSTSRSSSSGGLNHGHTSSRNSTRSSPYLRP